jgi:hypothetical protein
VTALAALLLLPSMGDVAQAQTLAQMLSPEPVGGTGALTPVRRDAEVQTRAFESGASTTGFDSANRKRAKAKANAKARPGTSQTMQPASSAQASVPARPNRERVSAAVAGTAEGQPQRRRIRVEEDPFGQVGFYAGSMLVKTAVELIGGYDTNPARTTNGRSGAFYAVAPELLVNSEWSRHALNVELRGAYTGYGGRSFANPSIGPAPNPVLLDRPEFTGRIFGRYDITRDLRIEPELRAAVGTDDPGSPDISAGLQHYPLSYTTGGALGVAQRFNRLDLSVKGASDRTTYADSKLTNGATASNSDRNFNQHGLTARASYELTPGIKPFIEGALDRREHDSELDRSGYQRDSSGVTGRVGTTFELTRLLTGEISAGFVKRDYEDARLKPLHGALLDASLVWSATSLTKATFTAKSGVAETTLAGVSGTLTRDFGVQVDHAFRRWLVGTAKLGYGTSTYDGLNREDKRYLASAALTYKLTRTVHLKGEFRREWLTSQGGSDYAANVFLVGVRLQR